ncbi:hypothetical protein B0A49_01521 [Cryomyces minteri]|uniref:Uncharacterized protein n=1 Tax=Cryomyces minteri TaxID=331657 RepID=A0A4U0XTJ4_9PEZI|nr:hypothetical protein B0A49_01521 [Cryomyces minteri]
MRDNMKPSSSTVTLLSLATVATAVTSTPTPQKASSEEQTLASTALAFVDPSDMASEDFSYARQAPEALEGAKAGVKDYNLTQLTMHTQENDNSVNKEATRVDFTNLPSKVKTWLHAQHLRENFDVIKEHVYEVSCDKIPGQLKDWLEVNPGQTAFYVANGLLFIFPGLLTGPLIWSLGWTSTGPRPASAASALQPLLGTIPARGGFATLQSYGMGGYGVTVVNTAFRGGALVAGAAGYVKSLVTPEEQTHGEGAGSTKSAPEEGKEPSPVTFESVKRLMSQL